MRTRRITANLALALALAGLLITGSLAVADHGALARGPIVPVPPQTVPANCTVGVTWTEVAGTRNHWYRVLVCATSAGEQLAFQQWPVIIQQPGG